jgi:hypothetical protein
MRTHVVTKVVSPAVTNTMSAPPSIVKSGDRMAMATNANVRLPLNR